MSEAFFFFSFFRLWRSLILLYPSHELETFVEIWPTVLAFSDFDIALLFIAMSLVFLVYSIQLHNTPLT